MAKRLNNSHQKSFYHGYQHAKTTQADKKNRLRYKPIEFNQPCKMSHMVALSGMVLIAYIAHQFITLQQGYHA